MNLQKSLKLAVTVSLVGAIAVSTTSCGIGAATVGEWVDPGHVALLVDNYGDSKGFEQADLIRGGRVSYNSFSQTLVEAPVYFVRSEFKDDASLKFSLRGVPIDMGLGITYRFKDSPVDPSNPKFTHFHAYFQKYRRSPDEFAQTMLLNGIQDAAQASGYSATEMLADTEGFLSKIKSSLTDRFPDIVFQTVSVVGQIAVPEKTQAAANATAEAQQQAEAAKYRKEQAEAEAAANVAEATGKAQVAIINAEADAKRNAIVNASLTPQLIELERIKTEQQRWSKWNGQMAPTIQTPTVQLGAQSAPQ